MSRLNAEAIVEYVERLDYGDEISLDRISQLIGEEVGTYGFSYSFAMARNILIEQGIVLKSNWDGTVKILNPNEVSQEVFTTCIKSGVYKFQKGIRMLEGIKNCKLTKEERAEYEAIKELSENLIRSSKTEINSSMVLLNQKKYRELGE